MRSILILSLAALWLVPSAAKPSRTAPAVQYFEDAAPKAWGLGERDVSCLEVKLHGNARVYSVRLSTPDGKALSQGGDAVVLNCARNGECVSLPATLPLHVKPGSYPGGLRLEVTDRAFRVCRSSLPALVLKAGKRVSVDVEYSPDPEILFCEHYDTYARSGNPWPSPDDYFQSNDYNVAVAAPVLQSEGSPFALRDLRRLGLWNAYTAFRCAEQDGFISVGARGRGIYRTARFSAVEGIRSVTVRFDLRVPKALDNPLLVRVQNGGYIVSATLDGMAVGTDRKHRYYAVTASVLALDPEQLAPGSWHRVELQVERATDGMELCWMTEKPGAKSPHFHLDNVEVLRGPEMPRGRLRVLYWNIQNGMWSDQHNNYDNFVAWVRKYDPDICIWCEASSIYYDKTSKRRPKEERYLPAHWGELAARYGHAYAETGGFRDNYPQTVTSRYPITTLLKITDTEDPDRPVAHGAGLQQVTVDGRRINIVTMHTWPHRFRPGMSKASQAERDESARRLEGIEYRAEEMQYVVDHTLKNPAFAGEGNEWILAGDLNSRSRVDQWHFNDLDKPAIQTLLKCQDVLINQTDLVDILAARYPGDFMASTYGNSRIDNVYASPALYGKVKNAMILIDGWTSAFGVPHNEWVRIFKDPSDHRPYLVDFE